MSHTNPLLLDPNDYAPTLGKKSPPKLDPKQVAAMRNGLQKPPIFVDLGSKGAVLDTIPNTQALLNAANITLRRNLMTRDTEYSQLDQTRLRSAGKAFGYRCTDLLDHAETLADESPYHPVKDWILSKSWDGVDRFSYLANTLVSDMPADFKKLILKKWLIQCAYSVMVDMPKRLENVLVLTGAQGKGKTAWIESLCPLADAVKIGEHLNPHDKDQLNRVTTHWIVELGELDGTFRRSDIASLKAFLSKPDDTYRLPYAKQERTYIRRVNFCASVNVDRFLADETGNRRWWVIPVTNVDYQHKIDMQQLWAQVQQWWSSGATCWMDATEQAKLADSNAHHEQPDPADELLKKYYGAYGDNLSSTKPMTATDITYSIIKGDVKKSHINSVASALKKLGYQQRKSNGGIVYDMPQMRQTLSF